MHESTISRVTTNKYVETPQGLFELKYFFHSGIASGDGEMVSSVSVKKMIQDLLADEDPAEAALRPGGRAGAPRSAGPHHRAAHGRQVSRGARHPALAPAPAGSRRSASRERTARRARGRHAGDHQRARSQHLEDLQRRPHAASRQARADVPRNRRGEDRPLRGEASAHRRPHAGGQAPHLPQRGDRRPTWRRPSTWPWLRSRGRCGR